MKVNDPFSIRRNFTYPDKVEKVEESDQSLYQTHISGASQDNPEDKCVTYKVPISDDGRYELSLKTLETLTSPGDNVPRMRVIMLINKILLMYLFTIFLVCKIFF